MLYKGYSACTDYDDKDEIFTGHIAGIQDGVGVHADTLETLYAAFHEVMADYVETCQSLRKAQSPTLTSPPYSTS